MGHNTGLYCTQSTVRRGVEKQIKLQQTRGMQRGAWAREWGGGGAKVCQPTRPLNRCKIFDSELATVQWGEERCSLLERGGGGCGPLDGVQRNVGSLVPLHSLFLPTSAWTEREVPKVTLTCVWNGHWGRCQCHHDTSCELFHIWAIINHGLRLG